MAEISWGSEGKEWTFSKATKTYDISGGSPKALKIATTEGPPDISFSVSPEKSALVVVDMQNFFLSPKCRDHPTGLEAVAPTIKVIEKFRSVGIQVIWLNWGLTDTDMQSMPPAVQRGFMKKSLHADDQLPVGLGIDMGDSKGRCLFADTWNAALYPPLQEVVQAGDIHCAKNRMSGLWAPSQPLWRALVEEKIETVFFAGVNTDQCVLGTLTDAYNAGWGCVLVDDCCATTTEGGKEVCLHNVSSSYGFVTTSTAILAA